MSMKKKPARSDVLLNLVIVLLSASIIITVVYKFVIARKNIGEFSIKKIENIQVSDLNSSRFDLTAILEKDKDNYLFLFELTNCYSCIGKGIADLKNLRASGNSCHAIAVSDYVDEVAGWSVHQEFDSFFVLKKSDFYRYIHASLLPVVFCIKNGKVTNFRFITP